MGASSGCARTISRHLTALQRLPVIIAFSNRPRWRRSSALMGLTQRSKAACAAATFSTSSPASPLGAVLRFVPTLRSSNMTPPPETDILTVRAP